MQDKISNITLGTSKKRKLEDANITVEKSSKPSKMKKSISPSGISINWQMMPQQNESNCTDCGRNKDSEVEQIVGAKGIKQGKKSKRIEEIQSCASRLSRHALFYESFQCLTLMNSIDMSVVSISSKRTGDNFQSIDESGNLLGYQCTKNRWTDKEIRRLKNAVFEEKESPLNGWLRSTDDNDFKYHIH
jgi:hypothetical protein